MTTGRRRKLKKPKGKEGFCWAWKKGHKERGVAAEKRRDREAAETHRCHRKPEGETARCYLHGGTTKRGPAHHSYKNGFYSSYYHGMLARAGEAQEAVEAAASSIEELGIHKVVIAHKLGEINATGPSDAAWRKLGGLVDEMMRLKDTGDRKGQAAALNQLLETITITASLYNPASDAVLGRS